MNFLDKIANIYINLIVFTQGYYEHVFLFNLPTLLFYGLVYHTPNFDLTTLAVSSSYFYQEYTMLSWVISNTVN